MSKLNDLPVDILFEVILHTANLRDLYNIISSCKGFFQAFDQRRALTIQEVFIRQTITYHDNAVGQLDSTLGGKVREEYVYSVARAMKRCMKRPDDALCLGFSAWKCFVKFDSPLWVHVDFGQMLVSRCMSQERHELAISVASDLWYRMLEGRTFEAQTTLRVLTRRELSKFAQKLAIMYANQGRHEDAVRTFREHYQSQRTLREYDTFSALIKICRKNETLQGGKELVAFSSAQIAESRRRFLELPMRASNGFDHYWSHCLVTIFLELGRYNEAVTALDDALTFSEQSNSGPMILVGLSRKLIKQLKEVSEYEEALRARRLVFDFMRRSSDRRTSTSSYLAWAKEYASDLRMLSRREEALEVEVLVWESLQNRVKSCNDRAMIYHYRNAAWGLCKAYRDQGYLQKASEIQHAYEDLAANRGETLFKLYRGVMEEEEYGGV